MIISASRRTDIPSYYGKWFVNRLLDGYVLIQNPYNAFRLSRLQLSPDTTDCIVFWTKNPAPMFEDLKTVSELGYNYYFQYTITPYGEAWESNLPSIEKRLDSLCFLSDRIGKQRIVWRYDPIIFNDVFSIQYHVEHFAILCEKIYSYIDECIISFVDNYNHLHNVIQVMSIEQMQTVGKSFSEIAKSYQLKLSTCSEKIDLQKYGIMHASCVDKKRIERIVGCSIKSKKDTGQRPECGCIESVDIGSYGTCLNGCKYCYATKNRQAAQNHFIQHDPASPMLIGWPTDSMIITERKARSTKVSQISLF